MKIPALLGGWWVFFGELNSDFGLAKGMEVRASHCAVAIGLN
jgi:hypothetical protein